MFKRMTLFGIVVLGLFVTSLYIWKDTSEKPGNIIKSAFPTLTFSKYEVLYSSRNTGVFGGSRVYLIKIADTEFDNIIKSCTQLGFKKSVYDYKKFPDYVWDRFKVTPNKLGLGIKPACHISVLAKEDRKHIIIDNGYIYFSASFR